MTQDIPTGAAAEPTEEQIKAGLKAAGYYDRPQSRKDLTAAYMAMVAAHQAATAVCVPAGWLPLTPEPLTAEALRKAMARVWNLGQTYWHQADSESYAQNRRSDDTRQKYLAFVEETVAALAHPAATAVCAEPLAWLFQHDETGRMVFCPNDGVNTLASFVANNPRLIYVAALGPIASPAASTAGAAPDLMLNGMTEEETSRTASVAGLGVSAPSSPPGSLSQAPTIPDAAGGVQSVWPTARDVVRPEDMGQAQLRVMLDGDNDVIVDLWEPGKASVSAEFCNPGACGGGRSRKTRMALIALMKAIEEDNASNPIAKDAGMNTDARGIKPEGRVSEGPSAEHAEPGPLADAPKEEAERQEGVPAEAPHGEVVGTWMGDGAFYAVVATHPTPAQAAPQAETQRCPNCDDTGDVHSIDGEWRGICHCPAGQALRAPQTAERNLGNVEHAMTLASTFAGSVAMSDRTLTDQHRRELRDFLLEHMRGAAPQATAGVAPTPTDEQLAAAGAAWFAGISDGLGTHGSCEAMRRAISATRADRSPE